jgi:hypothetical protein
MAGCARATAPASWLSAGGECAQATTRAARMAHVPVASALARKHGVGKHVARGTWQLSWAAACRARARTVHCRPPVALNARAAGAGSRVHPARDKNIPARVADRQARGHGTKISMPPGGAGRLCMQTRTCVQGRGWGLGSNLLLRLRLSLCLLRLLGCLKLRRHPATTREQARHILAGTACVCTPRAAGAQRLSLSDRMRIPGLSKFPPAPAQSVGEGRGGGEAKPGLHCRTPVVGGCAHPVPGNTVGPRPAGTRREQQTGRIQGSNGGRTLGETHRGSYIK